MAIKDYKLKTKFIGGFGIVLFITAILGFVAIYSMNTISNTIHQYEAVYSIQFDFLEARRFEKNFMIDGTTSNIDSWKLKISQIYQQTNKADALFIGDDKNKIKQIELSVKDYESAFLLYLDLFGKQTESMKNLRDISQSVYKDIADDVEAGNKMVTIVGMWYADARKNEKEVILSLGKDEAWINQWKSSINKTNQAIKEVNDEKLGVIVEKYSTLFIEYLDILKKENEADQIMRENARKANEICLAMADEQNKSMEKTISSAVVFLIIFVISAILIGFLISILISNSITKSMLQGVEFAKKISQGDLSATVEIDQKDEVGQLAEALKTMTGQIKTVIEGVLTGAQNITSASEEMSTSAQQMSQGSTEQASAAEEVSSSMEQMAANIQQNTDNAQQTDKIANFSVEGIRKVAQSSFESLTSIKEIAGKITIIDEIAFQTNILALNAAVEAARAGEYGKGFAVVAAEVRKLAERSKIAANEIISLSKQSVSKTEESTEMLNKIIPEIEKTARLVQEIAASSIEQNSGANQVNNALQQLNEVTQQNAAAAEEMATSAEELASQAQILMEMVQFFKGVNITVNQRHKSTGKTQFKHINKTRQTHTSFKNSEGVNINLGSESSRSDDDFERF